MDEGRHTRRRRRAWAGLCATGVVAALTTVTVLAGTSGDGGDPAVAASAGPRPGVAKSPDWKPVLAAGSTSTIIKQPAGPKAPVTDAAVIEQLSRLVPKGRTSGYAKGPQEEGRYAFGQLYVDTGKGPGMIRVFIYKGGLGPEACSTKVSPRALAALRQMRDELLKTAKTEAERREIRKGFQLKMTQKLPGCRDLPGGGRAIIQTRNPRESTATVDHGNGVTVHVLSPSWLAFNGTDNPPGTVALTPEQALKIAAYPGWGARMDASLVAAAAKKFPSLPTVY